MLYKHLCNWEMWCFLNIIPSVKVKASRVECACTYVALTAMAPIKVINFNWVRHKGMGRDGLKAPRAKEKVN